jgi:surfactin synthase thioesterase subunit/glycosyltransferase involved in cell wall biosynthesis
MIMRILLASNAQYFPAHGGGERSNRMLMEALAARGHQCQVVTRLDRFGGEASANWLAGVAGREVTPEAIPAGFTFDLGGIRVVAASLPSSFRAFFQLHKDEFRPDVIVVSTDDPAQILLETAVEDSHATTVYLARATVAVPFGPDAAFRSEEKTAALRRVDAVIGVSEYVARYIKEHSGIDAIHVPIALPDREPHPVAGRFDNEYVTLVNPCAVKGISVFLALAGALPSLRFAAVPTWGTTADDLRSMASHPNIEILPKVDRINDLLIRTRVLLVPSLWAEARSRIVVEAMLAGVPTIASNLGGLPEAKMHVPYILPVQPIEGYTQKLNEQMVPVANVPPQDIEPWREALVRLTSDRAHWQSLAATSRAAALHYADTTTVEPFETLIRQLKRKPRVAPAAEPPLPAEQLRHLSPERRRLLELKLRKQAGLATDPVLPLGGGRPTERLRIFCFPPAGGGASSFRSWRERLAGTVEVAAVQYPGRESRHADPFPSSFEELVRTLAVDLRPYLSGPFVFFGHSMGATVAFELARLLRSEAAQSQSSGLRALIVSAARAPQFRLNYQPGPDPAPEEFLAQVRRLGGLPPEVEADPRFLAVVLPVLRADAALFRRYCYQPAPPLDIPILAAGGDVDPQVTLDHLAAWKEQTTSMFEVVQFPGGHFYLRDQEAALLGRIGSFQRSAFSDQPNRLG